jgi:hypothetical protein
MKMGKGFKRITLLLSIIVGLSAGFVCYGLQYSEVQSKRLLYKTNSEDLLNIQHFWIIWDANGWDMGKKGIVNYLETKPYGASFTLFGKTVYLNAQDVFPGIYKNMSKLPLDELEEKAQYAREEAIEKAHEKLSGLWGGKTPPMVVVNMLVLASMVGFVGFSIVWLLFFLMRDLILVFCHDSPKNEQNVKRN